MTAYYNEFDPKAASWLRELIKQGHIAPGEVDERSIVEVRPDDLVGYDQCHFFAGIGVWSHALRKAGWPDDRQVWTGSCPCQPFSAAGKRGGTDDARHLWPEFFRLIAECRPVTVFGEQVASKDGLAWLDAVHADLEGADYAVGAVDTCAAGFGAPHIRQRLYFVADAECGASERHGQPVGGEARGDQGVREIRAGAQRIRDDVGDGFDSCFVADADDEGSQGRRREQLQERASKCAIGQDGGVGELADDPDARRTRSIQEPQQGREGYVERGKSGFLADSDGGDARSEGIQRGREHGQQPQDRGPCNGFWSNAAWIPCRDGKWRAVEPGTFPLANGSPARVGRLRGYGNAIVAPQAIEFVRAYKEVVG